MNRIDDILELSKLKDFVHRYELEEQKKKTVALVLAILAGIAAIALIAFAIYKYVTRDEFEDDFEDDFDDDFEDDFEEEEKAAPVVEEDDFVDEDAPKAE